LEYNLNNDFSFQTGIGKVISKEGNLDANTLEANLVWRFGTPKLSFQHLQLFWKYI
jgi:hypothetical protein